MTIQGTIGVAHDATRAEIPAAATVQSAEVAQLLRRAHQRASQILWQAIQAETLTPAQYFVLERLSDVGPTSQNQLGRLTSMDPATTQGVVRRLLERDLVTRAPDPEDRRRITVSLTEDGHALVDRLTGEIDELADEILAPLARDDRDVFLTMLRRIG